MDGTDLITNGEIILEGDVLCNEWCGWMETGCFSAQMVREALAQFSGAATVRLNSGGGDPFEGEAIRVALAGHPGGVTVVVGGVAASAASLLLMGASRIEISEGSFIMIHDPSSGSFGRAGDHRREGERLDLLAATYASVYAARSGASPEDVSQMMADETWFGGPAAVEAGFADAVSGQSQELSASLSLVAAQAMHNSTGQRLQMCSNHFSPEGTAPSSIKTAGGGRPQAQMAATQELEMPAEENTVIAPANPTSPNAGAPEVTLQTTMAAPDTSAAELRGAEGERARQRSIRDMAQPFMASGQLTSMQVDALIDEGTPAEHAGNRMMAVMSAAEPPVVPTSGGARINRDETETRREGLVQAMMRNYEGPGAQFRGMRLSGLAMELAGGSGYDRNALVAQGMRSTSMMGGAHGVSDFAYITTEVMNRSLIGEYDRRGANWNVVTGAPMSASDFRELHAVRFGGDFQLKSVKEDGEYQEATLNDEAEGLKVERRGRTIHLTFEAVINDDMSAFNRIPREFAMAARVMEASMVWNLIRANAVLKSDKKALFHADHGNLAAPGGAISIASVAAGRNRMWAQKAFGSAKDGEDFLQITPDLLIVPPALEMAALQFTAGITPTKTSDANPYKGTLTPVVVPNLSAGAASGSDSSWYLGSSDLPPISVAYLEGYEAPTVQTI
ncbi:head maturation protease, ClpP-related [Pelagimonas varians]|uniref:ATP-dependent Clp protease proteolytic subunit n=1 Tax=Pelagimonas varians TaxID=696760 RepID=A0A238JYJ7_9RHOB|nr:head maturation protease, ClpP-related [Pelagimonas varians]SMX35730.1 ATP-dependent Clp protease proteolytic subunit [Pelagimonas varians]